MISSTEKILNLHQRFLYIFQKNFREFFIIKLFTLSKEFMNEILPEDEIER
jgi:polyphosphate kinase